MNTLYTLYNYRFIFYITGHRRMVYISIQLFQIMNNEKQS